MRIGEKYLNGIRHACLLFQRSFVDGSISYLKRSIKQRRQGLTRVDLTWAILTGAIVVGANLTEVDLDNTNIEDARSLLDTNLHGVRGLTKEQLEACKAKGAIVDGGSATSAPQMSAAPLPSP
jgi:uncharacterized protein YjbI with pentapeptide repeats